MTGLRNSRPRVKVAAGQASSLMYSIEQNCRRPGENRDNHQHEGKKSQREGHPQAVEHARHTLKKARHFAGPLLLSKQSCV